MSFLGRGSGVFFRSVPVFIVVAEGLIDRAGQIFRWELIVSILAALAQQRFRRFRFGLPGLITGNRSRSGFTFRARRGRLGLELIGGFARICSGAGGFGGERRVGFFGGFGRCFFRIVGFFRCRDQVSGRVSFDPVGIFGRGLSPFFDLFAR